MPGLGQCAAADRVDGPDYGSIAGDALPLQERVVPAIPPGPDPQTGAKVYVVDNDEPVRQALAFLLNTAGLSALTFESVVEFLQTGESLPAGCVVTPVRMPDMDGEAMVRKLKEQNRGHAVIVVADEADVPLAVQAMKAGAVDFIEKPVDDVVLLSAVRAALDAEAQTKRDSERRGRSAELLETLSPREREVLVGVVAGKSNKVVAKDLGISPRTVEVHRANLMAKTGATSLSDLVRFALAAGV